MLPSVTFSDLPLYSAGGSILLEFIASFFILLLKLEE
jgi:hypothetical protein